jgi:hypothetical protein
MYKVVHLKILGMQSYSNLMKKENVPWPGHNHEQAIRWGENFHGRARISFETLLPVGFLIGSGSRRV